MASASLSRFALPAIFLFLFISLVSYQLYNLYKTILFQNGFENGTNGWNIGEISDSSQIVQAPVRDGKHAMLLKHVIPKKIHERNDKSSEIVLTPYQMKQMGVRSRGHFWYGFSFYFPNNTLDNTIIIQWHDTPDTDLGEHYRHPPLVFHRMADNRIILEIRSDARAVNVSPDYQFFKSFELGRFDLHQWHDFAVHVNWSYDEDGLVEIFHQDQSVFRYDGPVGYHDKDPHLFKNWPLCGSI